MKYQCGFYVKHILQSRAEKRAYGYGGMIFRVKPVRPANETGQNGIAAKALLPKASSPRQVYVTKNISDNNQPAYYTRPKNDVFHHTHIGGHRLWHSYISISAYNPII